jgi:hypothetical protein
MDIMNRFGLALAAALLCVLAVLLAFHTGYHPLLLAAGLIGLAGTVVVTYDYPVSGTTAPTVVQTGPNGANMVTATVFMADTDTTATITHNWGLPATAPGQLFPVPIFFIQSPGTAEPIISFVLTNTNAVVMNKVSATGSGGTYGVVLLRPHSIIA